MLRSNGLKAAAYHAGLDPATRTKTQEAFAAERIDVVVATVAFGMGIDRSNVRCVIHTALPKSIEQYQQETGRAGRDGLEAECVLFFGAADIRRWEALLTRSASETGQHAEFIAAQVELLRDMQRFSESHSCRHSVLSRYFGQDYLKENCGACDVCLNPADHLEDSAEVARLALGCVQGLGAPFGVNYVVDILTASKSQRVLPRHQKLPQFGALKSLPKDVVRDVVLQLVEQRLLERSKGDRPVLTLLPGARGVLSGQEPVTLHKPRTQAARSHSEETAWRDVDRGLFEHLRDLRRAIAAEQGVAAFVVLSDATLRELARVRPTSLVSLRRISGIGDQKLDQFGQRLAAAIGDYCRNNALATDVAIREKTLTSSTNASREKLLAYKLFDEGRPIDEVAAQTGRARSTVGQYLEDYVGERKPASVAPWVGNDVYQRVKAVGEEVGGEYLRPVFDALNGEVSYDEIRVVLRHAGLR
jgi:ATP-dependent DNA helicase RecQ